MRVGDIVCAKSIEHRQVVDVQEDKNGRQRVRANRFGFKFQPDHSLLSQVGVFIYLGTYPEANGADLVHEYAEQQLRALGWTLELSPAADAVARSGGASTDGPRAHDSESLSQVSTPNAPQEPQEKA